MTASETLNAAGYDMSAFDVARRLNCTDQTARNYARRYPGIAKMTVGPRGEALRFHRPTVERLAALRAELDALTIAA